MTQNERATPPDLPAPSTKIPATDPSLRVGRPVGRRLRKSAVAVTVVGIVGFAGLLVLLATSVHGSAEPAPLPDPGDDFAKPVIPEAVRNAAVRIAPEPAPAAVPPPPLPAPAVQAVSAYDRLEEGKRAEVAAQREKRLAELLKVRSSGILAQIGSEPAAVGTHEGRSSSGTGEVPAGRVEHQRSSAELGADGDPNLQGRKNEFVAGTEGSTDAADLHATLRHPRSPFELKPGTIIPAVLETAINSDLPGPVIARVTQNICDSVHGEWLVVPQGSTLVAYYDSMVAWGQERVLVCWRQLELANGDSLDLGCMPAADATGQAGLNDQTNEHWWRIIKGAAVASMLTAATTAAAGNVNGYNPSMQQLWARGAASEMGNVGQQVTRRNIMVQPTLTVRQGMPVNVIITKTVDFTPDRPGTPCRPDRL